MLCEMCLRLSVTLRHRAVLLGLVQRDCIGEAADLGEPLNASDPATSPCTNPFAQPPTAQTEHLPTTSTHMKLKKIY